MSHLITRLCGGKTERNKTEKEEKAREKRIGKEESKSYELHMSKGRGKKRRDGTAPTRKEEECVVRE